MTDEKSRNVDVTEDSPHTDHIAWHPAFVQAIRLELERYQDVLQFISEYSSYHRTFED
jgi:hypothetical protein